MQLSFYKKALRMINFQQYHPHSSPLFKKNYILKFLDKVNLENTLFVCKSINNLLHFLFSDWFLFSSDQHNYETSWSSLGKLHKPCYRTNMAIIQSLLSATNAWNNSQKLLKFFLRHLYRNKFKKISVSCLFCKVSKRIANFQISPIDS